MKRLIASVLALVMLLCITSSFADSIRVPIDLSAMDTDELLSLATELSSILKERGYSFAISEGSTQEDVPQSEEKIEQLSENESDDTESLFEGATELSDDSFLADLAAGLCARWGIPDQDTSLLSDKQMVAYYSQLVNAELAYVAKYAEYDFTDSKLGEYAQNYINALQSQFIAITEYYGTDEATYNEYWSFGYRTRARYIYLINKAYGLEIPSQYTSILKEMAETGIFCNTYIPIEAMLQTELSKLELEFSSEGSKKYVYVLPFNFTNTGTTDISGLSIKINFLNDKDVTVDSGYLFSYENLAAGKALSTNKCSTDDHFTHISFTYSFTVNTGAIFDTIEGSVVPDIQYSWDGTIKKNGELASGQPVFTIENLISGWELNTSWNKTLYVPTLKFDVRNTGTGDADRVTVRCVFTNTETKEIWDEETTYVVGSSDTPLKVGYSKKAFVYSSVGYKSKISTTPELSVEIYINDERMDTITIN